MADDDVIDYVVTHELAHITEMNHSDRFWAIVEDVLPDFRKRKERLKALQQRLALQTIFKSFRMRAARVSQETRSA